VNSSERLDAANCGKEPMRPARGRRALAALDARARLAPEGRSRDEPVQRLRQQILGRLKALGLSARQASLQAGLSPDCDKEIVAGRRRPRPSTLNRLGRVLGCELEV
jgi:lambda repressor-like predicted transcriptional regulator